MSLVQLEEMDYDALVERAEAVCACDGNARTNRPATDIHAALLEGGTNLSLSMVRKIVKAQREHHNEWDRHVFYGTPHVISICPYKGNGAESHTFMLGYMYPYLTVRKLHRRVNQRYPISLDEVRRIRQEAMAARKESERAGLFKVPKEIRAKHYGHIESHRSRVKNIDRLIDAVEAGDIETVEDLIRNKGVSANVRVILDDIDENEWTLLCYAVALNSSLAMIECLVRCGASVNGKTCFGNTPLHLAAVIGNFETARFLINNGADVNARDDVDGSGETVLHRAGFSGVIEVVRLLIANGAIPTAENDEGNTPLDNAKNGVIWNAVKANDVPLDSVGRKDHAAVIEYLASVM